MSSAAPADLAVAFRSMERRLREAQGDTPHELTAGAQTEVGTLLTEAAHLLNSTADPAAISQAIERVPADQWDPAVLDRLGAIALELGGWVRRIAAFGDD